MLKRKFDVYGKGNEAKRIKRRWKIHQSMVLPLPSWRWWGWRWWWWWWRCCPRCAAAYCFAIDSQRCIDTRSSFYFISFSLIFGCILIFPLLFLNCFHALSLSALSILVASSKLMDLRKSVCTVVCHRAFAVYIAFDFQMKIMCICVCMCSRLEETGDEWVLKWMLSLSLECQIWIHKAECSWLAIP